MTIVTKLGNEIHSDNDIPPAPEGYYWRIRHHGNFYSGRQWHRVYKMKLKRGWWTADSAKFTVYGWEDDQERGVILGAMQAAKQILKRRIYPQRDKAQECRAAARRLNRELRKDPDAPGRGPTDD